MQKSSLISCVCCGVANLVLSSGLCSAEEKPLNFFERKIAASNRTKAVVHATQIGLAMVAFEIEFGVRPGAIVAEEIKGAKFTTANDCFRQLIQGGDVLQSEVIFFAPSKISQKGDNDIGNKKNNFKQACAKGEVGFLYVDAPFAKANTPLVAAPLLDGESGKFDHRKYDGKAVVLMVDGSVQILDIDPKTGKVMVKKGGEVIDLFSKDNSDFGEDFKIRYPEPKKQKKEKKDVK